MNSEYNALKLPARTFMDTKHSTAIGFFSGFGFAIVSFVLPLLFPSISTVYKWCLFYVGLAFIFISAIALVRPTWFSGESQYKNSRIDIVVGHDGHYVDAKNFNVYNTMKSVSVGIKNVGGTYLTNCKLLTKAINAETNSVEEWTNTIDSFSLNQGEEKFISVAYYNEPIPPHPPSNVGIQLSAPPNGNFWRPPTLPKEGGAITLIASCAESSPCEAVLRLWVENERLRWEKA